jgi:hypothetical protein
MYTVSKLINSNHTKKLYIRKTEKIIAENNMLKVVISAKFSHSALAQPVRHLTVV